MCLFHCKAMDMIRLVVTAECNRNTSRLFCMAKFSVTKYNKQNVNEVSFQR